MNALDMLRDKRGTMILLTERTSTVGPMTCEVCKRTDPGGDAIGVIVMEDGAYDTPWLLWLLPNGWSVTSVLAQSMAACDRDQPLQGNPKLHLGTGPEPSDDPTTKRSAIGAIGSARSTQGGKRSVVTALEAGHGQLRTIASIINPGAVDPDEAGQLVGKGLDLAAATFYETIPTPLPERLVVRDDCAQAWSFYVTVDAEPIADDLADDLTGAICNTTPYLQMHSCSG